jgi:hypothetical protein
LNPRFALIANWTHEIKTPSAGGVAVPVAAEHGRELVADESRGKSFIDASRVDPLSRSAWEVRRT